ncbi:MAG: hypothetical protein N4A31_05400 [Rickettsiales bacterium]|jgi:thiaminase/transcriptional activator TenA|nr:hypothetical protein [Rickettsiales bacterium]
MRFSDIAWKQSEDMFYKIINHPFNQEMMNGTLSMVTYANYLEQDYNFVTVESKFEAMIAGKIASEYREFFLEYSISASDYAEEIEVFFQENKNISKTGENTPATYKYTDALLRSTVDKSIEVQVANFLPCVWYYRELGEYFANHPYPDNPYQDYIDSLNDPKYIKDVYEAIDIFNDLAESSSLEVKEQMLDAFSKNAGYEFDFFNDAYNI